MSLKYKDKVKILHGFYEGFEGVVLGEGCGCTGFKFTNKYLVVFKENKKGVWVKEENLKKIETPNKDIVAPAYDKVTEGYDPKDFDDKIRFKSTAE